MTSFCTCAYPGCLRRIPYELHDTTRPRYCSEHQMSMNYRLGNHVTDNDLYAPVTNNPNPLQELVEEPQKIIIVRCPICKTRKEVPADKMKIPCVTYGCEGTMIYHKDKGDSHLR